MLLWASGASWQNLTRSFKCPWSNQWVPHPDHSWGTSFCQACAIRWQGTLGDSCLDFKSTWRANRVQLKCKIRWKRKVKQWHCNSGEALTKSLQNWASSATAPHHTHTHTFQCSSYKSQPEPGWEIMMIISLSHRNTGPSLGSDDLIISH